MSTHFTFTSSDNQVIHAWHWAPQQKAVACVQIAHGMAEHAQRYDDFARFLSSLGIAVFANDHRGHGQTAGSLEKRGYFAEHEGWNLVVDDMHQLNSIIKKEYTDCPIILLGHSMGSFLSRSYISKYSDTIAACILSGTASHSSLLLNAGLALAHIKSWFIGKRKPDHLLDSMSFGAFNKNILQPKTAFDWLSHDESIVQAYIADDYCGFICTTSFFIDLLSALKVINNLKSMQTIRKDLPIYLYSGKEDPVGNYGKGVSLAAEKFRKAGLKNVSVKLYEGGRHEMLNELNKNEVYQDVLNNILLNLSH